MPEQPDTWSAAWRGLGDNPLAQYLRLAERRRLGRAGWLRRSLLPLLLLAIVVVVICLLYDSYPASGPDKLYEALADPEFTLAVLALLILPAYLAWAGQGLFQAATDALLVLAPPTKRIHHLALDDQSASSLLTDREVLAGFLAVLLPPLLIRLAVGAALLCVLMYAFAYGRAEAGWDLPPFALNGDTAGYATVALLAPVTFACFLFSGGLALLALLLYLIALSRELHPGLASPAAFNLVFMQMLFTLFGMVVGPLFTNEPSVFDDLTEGAGLLLTIMSAVIVYMLFFWMLASAERSASARRILALGAPTFAIALPAGLMTFIAIVYDPSGDVMEPLAYCIWGYMQSLGALAVLNPFSVVTPLCWGVDWQLAVDTPWPEWLRFPLLITTQLVLIGLFWRSALRSINLRRRAES